MAFTAYAPATGSAPTTATPGFTPYNPTGSQTPSPSVSLPPAKTPFQSPLQNIATGNSQDNVEGIKGVIKGVASSLESAGAANSGPVGAAMLAHAPALAADLGDLNEHLQPTNLPQAVGMASEKLGEAALPIDAAASGAADALGAARLKAVDPDILTGTITQGLQDDAPAAKNALASVDASKIKTYPDLANALNSNVKTASEAQDAFLAKTPNPTTLDKLTTTTKVGDQPITHNFVQDALSNLKELYAKTNDPVNAAKTAQLETKAQTVGLAPREVNDLARTYNDEFGSKAFSKTGDPLTSVTAQALENTRTGVKTTAANLSGDAATFKANDKIISDNIHTRELVSKVAEAVYKLQKTTIQRGWGETIGRYAGKILDMASGHVLKGAFESFIPRGQGFKIMNALDLQKSLSGNLSTLQKILSDPSITETQAASMLKAAQSSTQALIPGNSSSVADATK